MISSSYTENVEHDSMDIRVHPHQLFSKQQPCQDFDKATNSKTESSGQRSIYLEIHCYLHRPLPKTRAVSSYHVLSNDMRAVNHKFANFNGPGLERWSGYQACLNARYEIKSKLDVSKVNLCFQLQTNYIFFCIWTWIDKIWRASICIFHLKSKVKRDSWVKTSYCKCIHKAKCHDEL